MMYERTHAEMYPVAPNYFPAQDADFALSWFTTGSVIGVYSNPEVDELFQASRREMDVEAREALLQRIAEVLYEDPPAIFLFQPPELAAVSPRVRGYEARPDLVIAVENVTKE